MSDRDCKHCKHLKADGCSRWNCEYEPAMSDLIRRQDAIEAVATVTMSIHLSNVLCDKLLALPSADTDRSTRLTNAEWKDFLSESFGISKSSAREMLHGMMSVKREDNFKKRFNQRRGERREP